MNEYLVTFNFIRELNKSIMVQKKTKKMNKVFFIPKSIITSSAKYSQIKNLWKDIKYEKERISILLPGWYCEKVLGFYK